MINDFAGQNNVNGQTPQPKLNCSSYLNSPGPFSSPGANFNYENYRKASISSTSSRLLTVGDVVPQPHTQHAPTIQHQYSVYKTPTVTPGSSMDRKTSRASNKSTVSASVVHLHTPPKFRVTDSNQSSTETQVDPVTNSISERQKKLALSPPSLHISFDVAEPDHENNHLLHQNLMPLSVSTDNFRRQFSLHHHQNHRGCCLAAIMVNGDQQHQHHGSLRGQKMSAPPGAGPMPHDVLVESSGVGGKIRYTFASPTTSPILKRLYDIRKAKQQRSLEGQSDFADIGAHYMRLVGAFNPFKGILSAPEKTAAFRKSKTISQSTENDSVQVQICDPNSKLIYDKKTTSRHPSEDVTNKSLLGAVLSTQLSVSQSEWGAPGGVGGFGGNPSRPPSAAPACRQQLPSTNNSNANHKDSNYSNIQVNCRLRRRNELFEMRRRFCDYSFVVALLGIAMMILENEMTSSTGGYEYKMSAFSNVLKSLIVLSTLCLLSLIVMYHALEIKIFMSDNCCEDWRIAVDSKRILQLSLELLICSFCPIPGAFYFTWTTVHADGKTITHAQVPLDVLLSIPMFFRFYLVCRIMLLHSKLVTDASSRSIGALNRINFTARFVLKTLMTVSPGKVLLCFTMVYWMTAAWIMRLCERWIFDLQVKIFPYRRLLCFYGIFQLEAAFHLHPSGIRRKTIDIRQWHNTDPPNVEVGKFQNYLNTLWLIAVTSLTIGYGDLVPNTYCGRSMSVICGIMGAGTSSLVVAVVARKLELSRSEKHVHNFMIDSRLSKQLKHAAANILRETWFVYKNRKLVHKIDPAKIRFHQRKFLVAIYAMRRVKAEQRKLAENCNTLSDIAKTSTMMYELIGEMNSRQDNVDRKLLLLEDHFVNLDKKLQYVTGQLARLPDLLSRRVVSDLVTSGGGGSSGAGAGGSKSTAGSPCSVSGYTTLSCGAEPHGSSLSLNDYNNRL